MSWNMQHNLPHITKAVQVTNPAWIVTLPPMFCMLMEIDAASLPGMPKAL